MTYQWQPRAQKETQIYQFIQAINQRYQCDIQDYQSLYAWSITKIEAFWESVWEFSQIIASQPYTQVVDDPQKMPGATWFKGARLNYAENILRHRDIQTAICFKGQHLPSRSLTFEELYIQVERVAYQLRKKGIKKGDRIAGMVANMPETIVMMLAASSIGAIWSSCSPDFGIESIVNRFKQIDPVLLVCVDGYYYQDKIIDCNEKINALREELTTVELTVMIPFTGEGEPSADVASIQEWLEIPSPEPLVFEQLPFDHPLYILYSSGTTGNPKCIVHSAGGALIQHLKEHQLHGDIKRGDSLFYFTTCGWMMWNWLVSALATGTTIVLYEGSPFYPKADSLWAWVEEERITHFGTSATYLSTCQKRHLRPIDTYNLDALKTIYSTGGPLNADSFDYIGEAIKEDIQVASISGGTDIVSCFVLGNPITPVKRGKIQCRGLGMAVESWDESGQPVYDTQGELVCTKAAPSMPIGFWNDQDGAQYQAAYFDQYPNVWHHGDYIQIDSEGMLEMLGRSDTTLNPNGVRIGTAEIYRVIESVKEVDDSLVVGQKWKGDERIILFVISQNKLDLELKKKIRQEIKKKCSPRHVPKKIIQVSQVPYTINGKKLEKMIKKLIHGEVITNTSVMADPTCLNEYKNREELQT